MRYQEYKAAEKYSERDEDEMNAWLTPTIDPFLLAIEPWLIRQAALCFPRFYQEQLRFVEQARLSHKSFLWNLYWKLNVRDFYA